ncbi:MAG: efflux RND transporter periplasmic adaptor subunit [Rhodanobacteraceae bacterium]|jgi:HlyD family secretion protein|nr:efflux RND transporter periplasmic adaptor subunit [Rhodanobacteraceae bacterium]
MTPTRHSGRRAAVAAIAALAALAAGVAVWRVAHRTDAAAAYRIEASAIADITQTISANGTLNPVTLVNVGTQVSGTVQTLHADFNDHVVAGQVLLELDPAILRALVEQSEGNLANARAVLELATANEARARAIYARSFISRQDYQQTLEALHVAQAQVRIAQAQLDQNRANLRYAVIRSPVSGVVVERTVDIGQTVAASFQTPTLFRIAKDLKDMQIDSSFAEADIGQIRPGQAVTFTVDAFPGRVFHAAVRQVRLNPTSQQNVVTYDVVVGVQNPDEALMPGMTAYVNVAVAHREKVLAVPVSALRFKPREEAAATSGAAPAGGGSVIYVVSGGQLQKRTIVVGISDGRRVEVVSGDLVAGERVVVGEAAPASPGQGQGTLRVRMF